ncbi:MULTISPECIES: outer membrane beta-barrel family protein [unclassified Massilia]|uniref:outer membrane beta-barrel family protein n=1 Tax=unclassified Massilia TaxID=2609279 RepID=UPI00177D7CDC|nr:MULTISPECIES: outer membrane beta-barrel family protein [unclassified Massilia]MBD8531076.1 TonB-dependent receptor [Massilia sp. CFBP 13647]MBD8674776.1 TonB-dependent receptor [Massilia sp. CFBP 13721]
MTPKLLPALLLSCFAVQPLFAQTVAQTQPPEPPRNRPDAPAPAAVPAANPAPAGTNKGASTSTGTGTVTPEPEPQAGAEEDIATVQVVAARPTNKVDRDVYELKNDISVSNASAADILNNVPSVSVDQDGTVALRGNPNVQIMVNGKRDAQFQGQNRGDALNSFAAENIESIEVINVPGAEFGNEGGSGPIINLVLKRNRKPGSRATLAVNKGTEERYNANLNGEYAAGPYSLSGSVGVRRDERTGYRESRREDLDPATGEVIGGTDSSSDSHAPSESVRLASTLTYNVGASDQAGATFSYSKMQNDSENIGVTRRYGRAMAPTADFTSTSRSTSPAQNLGLGASYVHKSGEPGEELKFDLRYTSQKNDSDASVLYDFRLRPERYAADSLRSTDRDNRILDLSMDYENRLWETWQLKSGAKAAVSKNTNATNYLAVDPVSGAYEPVPSRISDFETDERTAALYASLSTKFFSDLRVQAGLRGEYTELDVRQPLLQQENTYRYTNWLPSLYVSQGLSDTGQLQLRVSRRVARPNERDLNPNLVYLSDFYARQGNPDLEPVNNDSAELAWRDRFFDVDTSVTLYKRRESPVLGNRSYPLATDPNVIVTSPVNFGANDAVGVELNLNARKLFIQGLSANLGATVGNETRMRLFNSRTAGMPVEQKNRRENARLRLAYQFDKESLQLSVNRNGRSLNGQGVNSATTMTNFTWMHRFSPQLSLNLNVNNLFGAGNTETFVENEILRLHTLSQTQPRVFSLGLRYQWGGVTGDERIRNGGRGVLRGPGARGGNGGGGNGGGRGFSG